MIQTKDVTFSYNTDTQFAFPNITCGEKQSLLITGGSGKGKTTLLHLLGGLLKPHSGSIVIGETEINHLSGRKLDRFRGQNIGMVLQESHFVESISVLENVMLASWLANAKHQEKKAATLLDALGLAGHIHKHPSQLSIGQQQRVSIARALINDPKLLLADEPTSSLDDENAEVVASLLGRLSHEHHAALVIVTHDQRLREKFQNSVSL